MPGFEFDLDDLLARYPLPDGMDDTLVNREQLANALVKSANTIDDYHRNKGMPVREQGGNGKPYVFSLAECWAWYHGWKEAEAAKSAEADAAANQLRLALLNDASRDDETARMSPREQREFYQAEEAYMTSANGRRDHVKRDDVIETIEDLFTLVRERVQAMPDAMERECGLTKQQVEWVVAFTDQFIPDLRDHVAQSSIFAEEPKGQPGALPLH